MTSNSTDSNGITEVIRENRGFGAKRLAHNQAAKQDLDDYFDVGEVIEVFIQTPPAHNGGEEAVAIYSQGECQDVWVFIDPGSHTLSRGSRVRCRIRYCGESFLKALAIYRLD